jgi:PadR family transcriptional regulator PadR
LTLAGGFSSLQSMKPYKKEDRHLPDLSRLEITILSTLVARERYGLEIVDTIKTATAGREILSLGGLYTTLHRMEQKGLVTSRWGESSGVRQGARRKYYSITGVGERALTESRKMLLSTFRLAVS